MLKSKKILKKKAKKMLNVSVLSVKTQWLQLLSHPHHSF